MKTFTPRRQPLGLGLLLAGAMTFAACGVLPAAPATDTLAVTRASMGEPMAQYALPDGQRLFYRVRPGEVVRLDFDATGKRVSRHAALSRETFQALGKSRGDAAAVQLQFGLPARRSVQEEGGLLWTYSWQEQDVWRMARVSFDKAGNFNAVEVVRDPQADERYR